MAIICAACSSGRALLDPQEKIDVSPYGIVRIARVTGRTLPGETLPNPNQTDERYDVGGTDLGIAWQMEDGKIALVFGDTYGKDWKPSGAGGPGAAGNWRSNVLAISKDCNLEDGLSFSHMVSKELIPSAHVTNGTGSHTAIPTAAVNIDGVDYVHCMDVRKWAEPGSWLTNYSAIYQSVDHGENWTRCAGVHFTEFSNFAQVAYAKMGGYVYMTGTASGRRGAVYLARFKSADILHQERYEYWNKAAGWQINREDQADPIISAPAGELSMVYYRKYKRWFITYLNEDKHELVLRTARRLNGVWSSEHCLASAADYPGLYGAFIYPGYEDTDEIFFLMSMWQPYNVFLMKARLKQ